MHRGGSGDERLKQVLHVKKIIIRCNIVLKGIAEGEALVTNQPLCLYDSLNPKTGIIANKRHELYGEKVAGKIFIFPYGIGSSSSSATILEAARCNKVPKAIINLETEAIIAAGAILAEKLYQKTIPIVDKPKTNPIEVVKKGDLVKVNANIGVIEITK
jgi:hypothetical protein